MNEGKWQLREKINHIPLDIRWEKDHPYAFASSTVIFFLSSY